MTLDITQEIFEKHIVSAISTNVDVFEQMDDAIKMAKIRLELEVLSPDLSDNLLTDEKIKYFSEAYVCLDAFIHEIPQIDLVLTPNGFGVTRTDKIAPASRDRVDKLIQSCETYLSEVKSRLLLSLCGNIWGDTLQAKQLISSFIYTPLHLRQLGVRSEEGKPIDNEEFYKLQPAVDLAFGYIETKISPEFSDELLSKIRKGSLLSMEEYVVENCRKIMACYIQIKYERQVPKMMEKLLLFIENNIASFPSYSSSKTYAAKQITPYENKKENKGFFFG